MSDWSSDVCSSDLARHRGVALDPELRLVVGQRVGELGVLEESLGGNTAHVQADTAPVLLFDDRDRQAELGCADPRDITTRTGTKDKDIEVGHETKIGRAHV